MNELAKDLKQHGFAESSFEAIKQASQIYGDDELTHEVKHGLIKNSFNEQTDNMGEIMDIENDRKLKKMQDNIDILTNKLNEIIKAINDMDARLTQLSKRSVTTERVIEKQIDTPIHHEEKQNVKTDETHETKSEEYTNQRVGNYQSQDVAIDKMFYYGKK